MEEYRMKTTTELGKKLVLKKETITTLANEEMTRVHGGGGYTTRTCQTGYRCTHIHFCEYEM